MPFTIKASKLGSTSTYTAKSEDDALAKFYELVDRDYIVHITDADTGAPIEDFELVNRIEDRTPPHP